MTPEQQKKFKYWQWRTIAGTMIGYIFFYLIRKNFSFAMPGLTADFGITKATLGGLLSAAGFLYGLSKLVNGMLADRINGRWHMVTGLAVSTVTAFIIGYGAEKQGTSAVHGAPLTKDGSLKVKEFLNWYHPDFYVSSEARQYYNETYVARGLLAYMKFNKDVDRLEEEDRIALENIISMEVVNNVRGKIPSYIEGHNNATRNISGELLNVYSENCDVLFGGSADVAGSVKTSLKNKETFTCDNYAGQNINFGIREHAMCAIANGIAAHGGLRPYVGSFLVFSDYAKGALRCAALMGLPVTYLFSHDSIAVGEDGPTHQPIEQIASLRMIPNFNVIRPCDANETAGAYEVAFSSVDTPTAIILTRQNLKTVRGCSKNKVKKGAYVLSYEKERLDGIILATGSEVNLAYEAQKELLEDDIDVRVVSMPSTFLFDKQRLAYKESVLPSSCNKILAVEMGRGDA